MFTLTRSQISTMNQLAASAYTHSNDEPVIKMRVQKGNVYLSVEREVNWRDLIYNVETGKETYPKHAFDNYFVDASGNYSRI